MPKQTVPKGFIRKTTFIHPDMNERLKEFVDKTTMAEYGILDRALREFFERRPRISVVLDPIAEIEIAPKNEAIAP